jgi:hypothetical protein
MLHEIAEQMREREYQSSKRKPMILQKFVGLPRSKTPSASEARQHVFWYYWPLSCITRDRRMEEMRKPGVQLFSENRVSIT